MAKYFTLAQCLYSNTAQQKGIKNVPGIDGEIFPLTGYQIKENINKTMRYCVNPAKDVFPGLIITSMYRSGKLNQAIGGSPTSQHCFGMAADIQDTDGTATSTIFNWLVDNLPTWDQVIWEFPERGEKSWIHISYNEQRNRKRTTLASKSDYIHNQYGGSRNGSYQHNIKRAYSNYISPNFA